MQRQWSVQAPGEPEAEPGGEELCEQEMKRLCLSQQPVRVLPYAMVDKRFIRQLREPEGVKTSCWQQWRRRRQTAGRRLGEAARRLTRGCGLWEGALYEIGGLFGTGIQSYFTFLRFLLLLNLLTLLLTSSFVLLPLVWLQPPDSGPALNFTLQCPGSGHLPQTGVSKFNNLLWNVFTGRAFNNTYLFYGAYQAGPESSSTYSIRLAYLLSPLACLLLCFCGILRRMVKGLPQKMFLGQDYRSPLSAKVFSSWDFCIRGQEAATIKKHEISNEFKMELEEGRHLLLLQQQTRAQRACHLLTYLRVNVLIGLLVVGAISAIFWATKYSQDNKEESLFLLLQYLPPGVIALVNFLGPLLFVFLVQLENYPPNTEVNLSLIWCVVLKLASLGMFSFSLGQTVLCIGRNKTSCESYGYNACDYQCWENSVGEELYKLSIFNFLLTVAFAFLVSLPRRMLVERFSGRFWAWLDREEFLVPKNVLDIVEGQTVTWMGLFYCPLLPLLNSVFIFLTFYIKKYTLLRNSRASPRRFRASSSIFFFQLVLLLGLLLAAVPLGYVVSSIRSSWDCGLFANYSAPWQVVPELVALWLPPPSQCILHYLGSHAFRFPLLILLSLVLTVCISQSQASSRAIRRLRKQLMWVFALIVFSCIFGEGYSNAHDSQQQYCVFNRNEDACRYGSAIGVLAFLASAFFFVVDIYFPQISNATDRKYLVIGDLLFSALWTFLWFVGFCFLTNQWAATKKNDVHIEADSARAAITFSFFSIFSWCLLAFLAYQRYKAGVDEFIQNYVDPTPDPSTAYASYPGVPADTYQQPPFTQNAESTEGYQPPPVY